MEKDFSNKFCLKILKKWSACESSIDWVSNHGGSFRELWRDNERYSDLKWLIDMVGQHIPQSLMEEIRATQESVNFSDTCTITHCRLVGDVCFPNAIRAFMTKKIITADVMFQALTDYLQANPLSK